MNFQVQFPFLYVKKKKPGPSIIDLSNNKLSGFIPFRIGYCRYLFSLNLGRNNLTGNIPIEVLQQNSVLHHLQLNDNNLSGCPLDFISKLAYLRVVSLANNKFGGTIPTVFNSSLLRILSLRSNKFNGSIPKEISNLQNLQILDLSQNNLTGIIPRTVGNLQRLVSKPTELFPIGGEIGLLFQMSLKGNMMQFQKLYSYSAGIDLSCNDLEGNIPEEIGQLKGLPTLNLSHNRFSGVMPPSVGSMSGLESLDSSFSNLSGKIPHSLVSVRYLGYLNLSYNNLSGRIPREAHFDTLSGDGSAYANNTLLCGFYTNHVCEDDQRSNPPNGSYEDVKDKLLLYAIVALGFAVGFWGLFFVLLLKKEKWWFVYWRLINVVAVRVVDCMLKD
ncbi:receptor-like protein EIX2 [Papaver somniferum]|uniref:receptor-like protein EIX2 n=1 Tax=Papaver somniferum TaxID=3469 RepID=UPI000E6FE8F5|nr:receptor-like protein EIX2 [Papaver somniferum]